MKRSLVYTFYFTFFRYSHARKRGIPPIAQDFDVTLADCFQYQLTLNIMESMAHPYQCKQVGPWMSVKQIDSIICLAHAQP